MSRVSSAIAGAAAAGIKIILEWNSFETCLDRLESSKAFLNAGPGAVAAAMNAMVSALQAAGLSTGHSLPTMNMYEERLETYRKLMGKYGNIIDRDISTIKAAAMKIETADNSN